MSCASDCAGNCPFVSDPQKSTRYVCLKCGLKRDINDDAGFDPLVPLLLIAPLIFVLLLTHRSPTLQPDPAPTEFPSP